MRKFAALLLPVLALGQSDKGPGYIEGLQVVDLTAPARRLRRGG